MGLPGRRSATRCVLAIHETCREAMCGAALATLEATEMANEGYHVRLERLKIKDLGENDQITHSSTHDPNNDFHRLGL